LVVYHPVVIVEGVFGSMAKSKKKCETVFLVCKETGEYNYTIKRKPGGEKLNIKKYCPTCRKHTEHAEKKK
jgi:large subunit ribosomal protein L33